MKESDQINNNIHKIILGLRLVLRNKSDNLSLTISMGNGFLGLNYPLTKPIQEYDKAHKKVSSDDQQNKFQTKFSHAIKRLDKIQNILSTITSEKIDESKINIKSFQDISSAIDEKLDIFEQTILRLINKIPKQHKKETLNKIQLELNNLIKGK